MNYKECPTCGGLPIDVVNGVCNQCRREGLSYRPTNIDMVVDAMQHSRFGPLSQVFIMEAILRYAEQIGSATVADLTPDEPEPEADGTLRVNIGIDPKAWIGVAQEIKTKLETPTCGPCGLDE